MIRGRMGEEREDRGGQVEGRLSAWGSNRSHWFLVVHQARPRLSGSLAGPPPLVARGEEGSVAAALWPLLCPAVCSAGSTIQYFGADRERKSILLYFYTTDLLSEEEEDRGREGGKHICLLYSLAIKDD